MLSSRSLPLITADSMQEEPSHASMRIGMDAPELWAAFSGLKAPLHMPQQTPGLQHKLEAWPFATLCPVPSHMEHAGHHSSHKPAMLPPLKTQLHRQGSEKLQGPSPKSPWLQHTIPSLTMQEHHDKAGLSRLVSLSACSHAQEADHSRMPDSHTRDAACQT